MDSIRERVGRITDLSTEELSTLRSDIVDTFNELNAEGVELNQEIVNQMNELAEAATAVTGENSRREAELAELSAARDLAAQAIVVEEEKPVDEVVVEDEEDDVPVEVFSDNTPEQVVETVELSVEEPVETTEVVEAELSTQDAPVEVTEPVVEEVTEIVASAETVEEPVEETVVEEPVVASAAEEIELAEAPAEAIETEVDPVTASAENLNVEVPSENAPKPVEVEETPRTVITAGADIAGITAGSVLPNLRSVAQALLDRKKSMGRTTGGDGEQQTVAVFSTSFPEERTLRSDDLDGNSAKVADVLSPEAITAAGGLCAPVETRYEVYGLGERGRPVRDSLAVFGADRGGIRFVTPPTLSYLNGSVSLWTLQDDIDASTPGAPDPVKPCIRVACGSEVVVYTDAIPLCLTFGNLGARAYPELVERHLELGMVLHDRFAETRLLTRIGTLSTAVTTTDELGAARDTFVAIDKAAAGYRNRHRLSSDSPLRAIFPEWFQNALRADLTKQIPGDTTEASIALAESTINEWFKVRNINVTWTIDGETGQIMGDQAAGPLNDFPTNVIWYLFSEGTFLFLDGGTLDLGLVRDSTLNGTNDYKIFLETFEGVAKVGIESLKITSPVKLYGASAATVETTS